MRIHRQILWLWLAVFGLSLLAFAQSVRIGKLEKVEAELQEHKQAVWNHLTDWERAMYVERENRIGDLKKQFNRSLFLISHPDGKLTNIIIWKPESE